MGIPAYNPAKDSLAKVAIGPYLRQAATELAGTRFYTLLTVECQDRLLERFGTDLCSYAHATLDELVKRQLAQSSLLWASDTRLVPQIELKRAKEAAANEMRAHAGVPLDEVAPLLRQELARQVRRFVCATTEMCERIWRDRHAMAVIMPNAAVHGIGRVLDVDVTQGDPHNGGRRTCIVTCEAGRFVYKPHDCRIDCWFRELANRHLPGALLQPVTLARKDASGAWAFQEFVCREPVTDEAGVGRYWHNMGRAAALFQALGSEDLHFQNIVAAGDKPSLVDAESVLCGVIAPRGDSLTHPRHRWASQGFGRDLMATFASSSLLSGLLERKHNVSPLYEHGAMCLPIWLGEERDALGYQNELLAGLDEGLVTLERHADELSRDVRMADALPVRRIFRNTNAYGKMLARLCQADAFCPEVRHNLLDSLQRMQADGTDDPPSPLVMCEIASLEAGDVPYFWNEAGSRTVLCHDGTSDDRLLMESATQKALGRVRSLDEAHRSFVHSIMELSMRQAQLPTDEPFPACVPSPEPLEAKEALFRAEEVLKTLEGMLVTSPSGETSWLFRSRSTGCLERSTICLADGLGGMALFLAALSTRARDSWARDAALVRLGGCLDRMREMLACLESSRHICGSSVSLGMTDGLGGVVRSLDLVVRALEGGNADYGAKLSEARDLLDRYLDVAARVDVEHAASTSVYAGCAGLLLAISQCACARTDSMASLARRLVERMLHLRTLVCGTSRLWDTIGSGRPVSGLGNGQAGVAAALAAAVAAFGTHELFYDAMYAATDALAWELSCFRDALGTWPDLRRGAAPNTFVHGICSGAPGVGLAALAVAKTLGDKKGLELANELILRVDRACATLPLGSRDRLCCGTISVAEYLVSRGDLERAGCVLGGVVQRAQARGGYSFAAEGVRRTDEPDLLTGLAGVGYGLLRLADPTLPGVFVG